MFKCKYELGTQEYYEEAKKRLIEIGQTLRPSLPEKEREMLFQEQCDIIFIMEEYYPIDE